MPIVSVSEQFSGRTGTVDNVYARTYVRIFNVVTSDPYVGPLAVRSASGIPGIGAHYENGVGSGDPRHEFDNGSYVNSVAAEENSEGAGIDWKVTVAYGPWNPEDFGADPTLWKLRVTFGGDRVEKVIDFDRDGNPIRNSARDRFGDPIVIDSSITTMLITRNELVSTFDMMLASTFSDTINDDVWNGIPAKQAKMGVITTSEEKFDSTTQRWYYTVTYPVQVGRKPWKKELLDQGYNALQAPGAFDWEQVMPIHGKDGQPIGDPRLLDGTGHKLSNTGDPVSLPFEVYDEEDWSVLLIDLSLRLGL